MTRTGGIARAFAVLVACAQGIASALAGNPYDFDTNGIPTGSIAPGLPQRGDPFGARAALAERGVTATVLFRNDVLAHAVTGRAAGAVNQTLIEPSFYVDLGRFAGLSGAGAFTNFFIIHNTGRLHQSIVQSINTIAAIEAIPTVRLSEAWFEQSLFNGVVNVRFGQLAADIEFFFAGTSALFLHSDWPTIAALNLPSGGSAYPLATPGVRLKIDPRPDVSLLFGLFNGDPAGPGTGDEQTRNRHGLNFRVSDPAFVMAEAQFRANRTPGATDLARTVKVGGWAHLGRFDDQRFAADGTLLGASPGGRVPVQRRGNWGLYGVIEQQLYRPPGGDADSGLTAYTRISVSPGDRNPISFYIDGGLVAAGLVPNRPADRFGIGLIYSQFSPSLRAADRDRRVAAGTGAVRDFELNVELTYQAEIRPGLQLQPVLTYVLHPGGDPRRSAIVGGVRTSVRF